MKKMNVLERCPKVQAYLLPYYIGRKTFATLMLNKGVSLESVAAMLGHSSVEMTRQHYVRVSTAKLQRELQLAGVLAG